MNAHSSYIQGVIRPENFHWTLNKAAEILADRFPKANLLIGRGLSGACLIPALAAQINKDAGNDNVQVGIVRKSDNNHSSRDVEVSEWPANPQVVFIDDLISSGETFRLCARQIHGAFVSHCKSVAMPVDGYRLLGAVMYQKEGCQGDTLTLDGENYPLHAASHSKYRE